jgi:hypothetical protein
VLERQLPEKIVEALAHLFAASPVIGLNLSVPPTRNSSPSFVSSDQQQERDGMEPVRRTLPDHGRIVSIRMNEHPGRFRSNSFDNGLAKRILTHKILPYYDMIA